MSDQKPIGNSENKKKKENGHIDQIREENNDIENCVNDMKNGQMEQIVEKNGDLPENEKNREDGLFDQSGCFFCGIKTDVSCERCGIETCGKHKDFHTGRFEYKDGPRTGEIEVTCLPYRVTWQEGVGRCMVATRDIAPLELVLQDRPCVLGPNYETEAVCVHCLGRVTGECPCETCNLLFCGDQCQQAYKQCLDAYQSQGGVRPWHSVECEVFSRLNPLLQVTNVTPGSLAFEYGSITVLRLLSLRDSEPDVWERVHFLMDHEKERKEEKEYWRMFQVNVVDFLRKRCKLAEKYSEEEIHWAIGILRTNCAHLERLNMTADGTSGKALYPTFSFISHSCLCNCRYIIGLDDSMDLRAQIPIRKGEEISIQYISFLFGNIKRREAIKAAWMFECTCPRCLDPTENGTYLSALRCQKCSGTVIPISSDIDEETWQCVDCKEAVSSETALNLFKQLEATMFDTEETDIEKYEEILDKYGKLLHENHFQLLLVKRYMAEAFKGQITVGQVKRKIELNQHFMDIFTKVDPGHTKWRAKLLYEVSKTKLFLADLEHTKNQIKKEEFIEKLKENIKDMNEVMECLFYETPGTREYIAKRNAKYSMGQTKDILHFASMM